MNLTAASFFTGAGGFDLGFEQAGIEIVFQCEIDKFARQLLDNKYPNTEKSYDISTLHPTAIPQADIYFGGFPCQDASVAGLRNGLGGNKTGLFFQFVRLIKAKQPQWICLENVPGILSSGGRNDFKLIIETLAQCGYHCSWRTLDSQYFGVPQRRRRVFLVGCLGNWRGGAEVLFESEIKGKDASKGKEIRTDVSNEIGDRPIGVETHNLVGKEVRKLHYWEQTGTLCASENGYGVLIGNELRRTTPLECERLMGFPDNWTAEFSDRQRYRMTGNAVAVPVAKFLGQGIVNVHRNLVENHFQTETIAA
jgi:DNA (cytosine-5)-methyltransferase 1